MPRRVRLAIRRLLTPMLLLSEVRITLALAPKLIFEFLGLSL